MRMTVDEHPLTPLIRAPDGYVAKQYVTRMSGRSRYVRPIWRARWGCWCVRENYGVYEIGLADNGIDKFKVL